MTAAQARAAWSSDDQHARAALSFLAEPGDPELGWLLRSVTPVQVLATVLSGHDDLAVCPEAATGQAVTGQAVTGQAARVGRALNRWRSRVTELPPAGRLTAWLDGGYRLACPGDPEWPTQLDDLEDERPVVLWLRGAVDLRFACLQSVSVVGARAATAYGSHVAAEFAAELAGRGWTVISGGAFGVDASAHRGALAASGCTGAVLASGLGFGYPKGHHDLFEVIAVTGVLASECPPDRAPTRPGFLIRNRVIAALSRGTVVVEAALRSGALNTARHASELNRPVMAVPGPITSDQSAGCHWLIRECRATCVTGVGDVIEMISPLGEADLEPGADGDRWPSRELGRDQARAGVRDDGASWGAGAGRRSQRARDPAVATDHLDPVTVAVLAATPRRAGRGVATLATLAGVDLDTAMRCLGLLAAAGHVERCDKGWRRRGNQ